MSDQAAGSVHTASVIAYQPALDGVRALAVAAVLLFHGEIAGFGGGYLGVSVFFTLSGFLITSLLAAEIDKQGYVGLGAFYARRARRLLPASVLLVVLVMLASIVTDWFDGVADLRAHIVGSLLQVANWVFLASGGSYQELLQQAAGAASPLEHYWSLAIEEQFYWLWPVAFVGIWKLGRNTRGRLWILGGITAAFVVAAPVTAAVWGSDAAYWASPARAAEILLGALLALAIAGRSVPTRCWVLAPAALAVLAVCIVAFPTAGGPAYAGWLPAIGVVSSSLLLGLQVDSPVRTALSATPLVWLGKVSYGVYLFHWPIFVVLNSERVGIDGPLLFVVRAAVTLTVAQLSFTFFEQPVRRASGIGIRPTMTYAAATTAGVIVAAIVVVPGAGSDYWSTSDDVAEAAALDTDDTPLLADPEAARSTTTSATATPPETTPPGTTTPVAAPASDPAASAPSSTSSTSSTSTPTTTTTTATITTTSTLPPVPDLARPVRMIVAGDSTAEAYGNGVVAWAAASPDVAQAELNVERGCGFVRGGAYRLDDDWFEVRTACDRWLETDLVDRVVQATPDVVLMVTTSWDVLDHRWDDGDGFTTDSVEMRDRLSTDFGAITDAVLAAGAGSVVWVEAPIPNPLWFSRGTAQEQPSRHAVLHEVMQDLAVDRPGDVYVVDLIEYFDDAGITADVETRPDGVHVTPQAAQSIAERFLGEQMLRAALDLF
ncbi:MAG: acyltransferase family protein [Ilumatobacter sp.]|uniref:acyltransferase family protein n=1 Tax=Ilumatobacter sp. TaxID=1967498 RepID=UPI003C7155B7